jgi:putative ABC transport system permease protein
MAGIMAVLLGLGAALGAMNTMYAAVAARLREIGTLRVLGFSSTHVLFSFLLESLAIATAGGAIGLGLALPWHGTATGAVNWSSFTELSIKFNMTPLIMVGAFGLSVVIGGFGGILPALAASRVTPAQALREL